MNLVELNFKQLPHGAMVSLKGTDLMFVRYIGEKTSEKARKDGEDPRTYYKFTVGGRVFTIDSSDMDSVELLRDKKLKRTVAQLVLQANDYQEPETDGDGEVIEGSFVMKQSFNFVAVGTVEDMIALAQSAGKVAKEEKSWNTDTSAVDAKKLQAALLGGLESMLPGAINKVLDSRNAAVAAPSVAPVAATEEVGG